MSPTTIAQHRFTNRNSTIAGNIKSCKSTLRKTFKSVAMSIAHALDDVDDFYGEGSNDAAPGGPDVIREYPELNFRCYSRGTSDVSAGTWVLDNYQQHLALPMGKLQIHRPPPTPAHKKTVSVAGSSDNDDGNANANVVSGLTVGGRGREVDVATQRKAVAGKMEDCRPVPSAHLAVRNASSGRRTGKTRPAPIILPSVAENCEQRRDSMLSATPTVNRPKRSPFLWTSRSIRSETTEDTNSKRYTDTPPLSDRTSSLLSGSISYFSKSRLVASRSSSTIRRLQVRRVSPTIDLTEKEDVETQPGLPQILVTQASTRCANGAQSALRSDGSVDTSAPSSSIGVPQVLRPVKARLVNIPPRSRATSVIEPSAKYGHEWRCGDATVDTTQSDVFSSIDEQRANRRKGIIGDNFKQRLSLYRPYNPRESWRTNLDRYAPTSSRSESSTSSQVSAEQNRQLISSLGISSRSYNRLLAALERGSFLSDSEETENEAEDRSEAPVPSLVSNASTEASSPVRIPSALRPQHVGTVRYSIPKSKVEMQASPADDVFVGKSLSCALARQQDILFEKEQEYRRAIQTLSESSSKSSSSATLASDDSTVLQARLDAMGGSTACYHLMMSAGNIARGRRVR